MVYNFSSPPHSIPSRARLLTGDCYPDLRDAAQQMTLEFLREVGHSAQSEGELYLQRVNLVSPATLRSELDYLVGLKEEKASARLLSRVHYASSALGQSALVKAPKSFREQVSTFKEDLLSLSSLDGLRPLAQKAPLLLEGASLSAPLSLIRALGSYAMTCDSPSLAHVLIFEQCDLLSIGAVNALLKLFEEPPTGILMLALSTSPGVIRKTLRSRLFPIVATRSREEVMQLTQEISGTSQSNWDDALFEGTLFSRKKILSSAQLFIESAKKGDWYDPSSCPVQSLGELRRWAAQVLEQLTPPISASLSLKVILRAKLADELARYVSALTKDVTVFHDKPSEALEKLYLRLCELLGEEHAKLAAASRFSESQEL